MNVRRPVYHLAIWLATASIVAIAAPILAAEHESEVRSVAPFDHIRTNGAFETTIAVGVAQRVSVSGPRAMLDRITTTVSDRTLVVSFKHGSSTFHEFAHLTIALPALRGFANEGAGKTDITGLAGGDLTIEDSGASVISARGTVAHELLTLNGAGSIDASGVRAASVTADNNGVGVIRLRSDGDLALNVNGVGAIYYSGTPTHVDRHVNGIGHIGPS